ncbi:MAG: iron-sulfur cluster insertion protein ErpA [Hyphomicrobiaceae bacterium]
MSQTAVNMTDRAARRINELAATEAGAPLFRISVEGGGCSGFQYKFDLVDHAEPDDHVFEREGARVVVDKMSMIYLAGSEVDFVDDLLGATFRINNPNAQSSCGCGTSFSL